MLRDLSLALPKALTYEQLQNAVREFPKRMHLQSMQLFDVYQGDSLGPDAKSMAATFLFQSPSKTLTDQDVDTEIQNLLSWLADKVGATQR